MFIIDFDDTLFDTHSFKSTLVDSVKKLGISEELFWQTYKEAYNNDPGKSAYNDEVHAEILGKCGFDKQFIVTAFQNVKLFLKNYLFSDAIDFLDYLKTYNQKLILLSLGQEEFQKMKIRNAGIEKYFDETYTTDDTKKHIIEKILNNCAPDEHVWLINDKIEETKNLVEKFPQINPILKVSPKFQIADYEKSGMPFFPKLNQIKEYAGQRV